MTTTLRDVANCIGLTGSLSIVRDFYGYATEVPRHLSLIRQLQLLKRTHINLNFVFVGNDFTTDDQQKLDVMLVVARDIYSTVNLGIGRVERHTIPE